MSKIMRKIPGLLFLGVLFFGFLSYSINPSRFLMGVFDAVQVSGLLTFFSIIVIIIISLIFHFFGDKLLPVAGEM